MSLQVGREIDGYELLDVVSSSRTRVVYRVRNIAARRIELMHMMPRSLQDDQERAERFIREMRILASLSHNNIVRFYDAAIVDGQLVMTTELQEGVPLSDRLELGPLPLADSLAILREILSAVAFAHQHGIVHREITPNNILLTPGGGAKLSGFTYAKSASDYDLTRLGAMLGDITYMPPEQVRGATAADARSDLYALGVVFFTMVTGAPPFQSTSQFDVMMAHVNTPPPRPTERNPQLPRRLDAVILKALAKDPDARYQTAAEFQAALDGMDLSAPNSAPAASLERLSPAANHDRPLPAPNHDRTSPAADHDRPLPAPNHDRPSPAANHDRTSPAADPFVSRRHRTANQSDTAGTSRMARDYIWPALVLAAVFGALVLLVLFALGRSAA